MIAEKASVWMKFGAVPLITFSTFISALLLVLSFRNYRSGPQFASYVAENTTIVSQVVHILSRILGTLSTITLCMSRSSVLKIRSLVILFD